MKYLTNAQLCRMGSDAIRKFYYDQWDTLAVDQRKRAAVKHYNGSCVCYRGNREKGCIAAQLGGYRFDDMRAMQPK